MPPVVALQDVFVAERLSWAVYGPPLLSTYPSSEHIPKAWTLAVVHKALLSPGGACLAALLTV
jgi:hypothetical protein